MPVVTNVADHAAITDGHAAKRSPGGPIKLLRRTQPTRFSEKPMGEPTLIAKSATFSCSLALQVHENVALSPIKDEDGASDRGDDQAMATPGHRSRSPMA